MTFKERLTDWGHLDIRDARSGAKFEAHGRQWTIVRIASGPTARRSHVVGTTDGELVRLYATCRCEEPGDEVFVIDIVTESFWRACSKCRALLPRGRTLRRRHDEEATDE
jgi:hypothetical protein